jgi:predicted ATPase/DNA-binding CsgD family transcriptional regulator
MPVSSDRAIRAKSPPTLLRPSSKAESVVSSLPRPLTSFIGREAETNAVRLALLSPNVQLLTLTGPGGAGKTRLAIQVAASVVSAFAAVQFVSLAALRDADLVLLEIAQALGVREGGGQSLIERLAMFFAEDQYLLVLDNFEQVLDAARDVTNLLALCPDLTVLVTSREVLHVAGEHDFPVPPLEIPQEESTQPFEEIARSSAVALFVDRAQSANANFALTSDNADAVGRVCARLDGLPLAIELAAAQSRLLSPAAMLNRLTNRLSLLTGGPRDQPRRLRTMRDAIAWGYDLMAPEEQRLFRQLSVFAGGCTVEAAEFVCAPAGDSTFLARMAQLVDKSMLVQVPQADGEPRLSMLETIREFGLERLCDSGHDSETRDAHARYYLSLATNAEPKLIQTDSAKWVERLAIEQANIREAVLWSLHQGRAEAVLCLAGTLLSLGYARGHPGEGLSWLEEALAIRGDATPVVQCDALFCASALAQVQGDFDRSTALSEEAINKARAYLYAFGEARALLGLGITAEWQGDLGLAASRYRRSHNLMSGLGETDHLPHWTVLPLANLADIALLQGDTTEASKLGEAAVQRWRETGYVWGIAQALGTVAAAMAERGKLAQAAKLYDETLSLWLACDDGRGIAGTIAGIAGAVRLQGQLDVAARLLGAAWSLGDRLGVRYLAHHLYAEGVRSAVKARLSPSAFESARFAGASISLEAAVDEARAELQRLEADAQPVHRLTPRELEVLDHIVAGQPDREIAELLSISPRTVQSHVANVFAKLNANTRAEAVAIAVRSGLV